MECPTSEGTLLSTLHGRDRRLLRNIDKCDLQAAIKYGVRERTFGGNKARWKFSFGDVVYITEDDEVTEVTSWVTPVEIPKAFISEVDMNAHVQLARKMKLMPEICTSHIVLVIDQSASMRTCDVDNFKTRSDAVFATVALDYIGQQIDKLHQTNAQYTDAVTLIEMNLKSKVIFEREPVTNVVFNKLLDRKVSVVPHEHGMFKSALDVATRVLSRDHGNPSCPLVLLFLSDGRPSDNQRNRLYDAGTHMHSLCQKFGSQLTVHTLGFGKSNSDFSVLERMADCATAAGSVGNFTCVNLRGTEFSSVMQKISSSMSATRQMCSVLNTGIAKTRTLRQVTQEAPRAMACDFAHDIDLIWPDTWTMYTEGFNRWEWRNKKLVMVGAGEGVAICKQSLGEGAERVVFRLMDLSNEREYGWNKTGERLVAKECKYVEDDEKKQQQFHNVFCKTQTQAAKYARKFNDRVRRLCNFQGLEQLATISFLPCCVYQVPEIDKPDHFRYILVDKTLKSFEICQVELKQWTCERRQTY